MIVRFKRPIAGERCAFAAGQRVTVKTLPRGWAAWLDQGIIAIEADPPDEFATAPQEPERAVRAGGRRASRKPQVA